MYMLIHLKRSWVMLLESLGVLGLSASYPTLPPWFASFKPQPLWCPLCPVSEAVDGSSPFLYIPSRLKAINRDGAAKPLHPTSTGKHFALKLPCQHSMTRPLYVSFKSMTHFAEPDRTRTTLCLSSRWWNLSCRSRFTISCKSLAEASPGGVSIGTALLQVSWCIRCCAPGFPALSKVGNDWWIGKHIISLT